MTYTHTNLVLLLPTLIELINKRFNPETVTKHHIVNDLRNGTFYFSRVYIKLSNMTNGYYCFDVCRKGEMWNPFLLPGMMSCAFDWLKSFDYNQKRQIERVQKFKLELIEKVWSSGDSNFLLAN